MKRTITPSTLQTLSDKRIQTLSDLVSRANLASRLGTQSFGGDRDIYQALGYLSNISYADYLARYVRQDIAKAVIDRPVKVTWQGDLQIVETDDDEETAIEKQWRELEEKIGVKSIFARADKLTGIGRYGVLLLGLEDVKQQEDFVKPATKSQLAYLKPFGEDGAKILTYETDTKNPRYGKPLTYSITVADVASGTSTTVNVHYSRVIHIVDDPLESDIYGTPRMEAVFNRLMDLEKLVGGDAEMFWRGARPGYQGKVDKDFRFTQTTKDDLKDQLDEFEHNLRRVLMSEGVDFQALAQQIADPATHIDCQIQMISAVTGIPKRILTGSERGELSSAQDKGEWLSYITSRREEHAEPRIVRPFVDRCIELGILTKPAERYTVKWQDLYSVSEQEKVTIGKDRAAALAQYAGQPNCELIMPADSFLEVCMGLTKEQVEMIQEQRDTAVEEDQLLQPTEDDIAMDQEMKKAKIESIKNSKPVAGKPVPGQEVVVQGGEGSGNFDHEGRPGEIGGSGEGGGSKAVYNKETKQWETADGKPLPEHLQGTRIPPAWTNVQYNDDPNGSVLVKGQDSKGRGQVIYSKKFIQQQADAKFARTNELEEKYETINKAVLRDSGKNEEAAALQLVMHTGIRPGGEGDTGGAVQAYGATTLEGRHIVVKNGKVQLQFVGKKGVHVSIPVTDDRIASDLVRRKTAVGSKGRIFDTDGKKLLIYTKKQDGGGFKTKDFRTLLGTQTAAAMVRKMPKPSNFTSYKKAVKSVAKAVATRLGNTPTVALQSYINPTVFAGWQLKGGKK